MEQITCPACGDDNLEKNTISKSLHEPYGGSKNIDVVSYTCNSCGFSGDILNENETALQAAIDELKAGAVKNILENFQKQHYNFSAIERALEIPQKSLSKWKSATKPSAAAVALLKYLHLFPWLIEVAEHKYDFTAAQRIHLSDAFNQFVSQMTFNEADRGFETTTTMEVLRLTVEKKFDSDLQEGNDQGFGFSFINQENECLANA